ncbi:hypothetical protein [Pseudoxanthomonas indica]|uniref:Uncharacterized protein n=1 Tax=Pseudoxanthomonas indica TaxID=428993 RepID=A0A1T5KC48_9GAMM|nr:hypothetical protein [Pseudoxanthomonas indica]GGD48208.1 hypothetical protein GCM10007235_20080 [Pseudoxanthomonas indica]SKC61035.1 hypothetical protein SAMN06296058_1546 [Pseudoxanthomonas indica]
MTQTPLKEGFIPEAGYAMPEDAYDILDLLESSLLTLAALATPYNHIDPPELILSRTATSVCLTELAQLAIRLKRQMHRYRLPLPVVH